MLRLDPGEGRIRTARNFQVWKARRIQHLARSPQMLRLQNGCRHRVVDNEIGHLVEDFIMQAAWTRTLSNGAKTTALVAPFATD